MTNPVNVGPKQLGAVQESDEDNIDEYLGYLTFSTTGEVLVPREWLTEQWDKHGLPRYLLPRQPSDWSAYRRTIQYLKDEAEPYTVYDEGYDHEFNCKFTIEKSDEGGSNLFIVYADVFWPEEMIGEEGGDWRSQRLGFFDYMDHDGQGGVLTKFEKEKDNIHYEEWKNLANQARSVQNMMKTHHNFSDLQKILQDFRREAKAVEIRRAVYFIGAHREGLVDGLASIWEGMNQFKDDGETMRIETTPVINLESQRELIAEKAETMVRDMVDEIIDDVFDSWDEDETSDSVAREILNALGDEGVMEGVAEYNALLKMKMSVKNVIKDQMDEAKDEEREALEKVLEQKKFGEVDVN